MNQENNFEFDLDDLPFDEFRDEPVPEDKPEEAGETPEEGQDRDRDRERQERDRERQERDRERPARRQRPKRAQKKNPVIVYLSILFAVAFLLLLLTFFMQQRDHTALMELNTDLGTQQETIAQLQAEKEQLTQQLQEAQKATEDVQSSVKTAEDATAAVRKTAQALEYLAQMERACRTSYVEGYRIAKEMEAKGLRTYLPTTSSVSGSPSPARVYQELCNTIFGNLG